jgi:hypothetical protein
VNTAEAYPGGNGAWVNLATDGPSIVVSRAGEYEAEASAMFNKQKAELVHGITEACIGNAAGAHGVLWMNAIAVTNESVVMSIPTLARLTTVAGDTIKQRYYSANSSGTTPWMNFSYRTLKVTPMRVA